MRGVEQPESDTRRVSRMIHVGLFSIAASIGMVFALLAEIQDAHNLSSSTLGFIAAVSFFAGVASQMTLAPLADRGHARRLMIGAVITAAIGVVGFALATTAWQFILARALSGMAYGAYAPAARALVSAADPEKAGERLGALAGLETAGFIVGPGIAAGIVSFTNLDVPFVMMAVVLLAILPSLARVHIDEATGDVGHASPLSGAISILKRRKALAAVILSAALILPAGMYEAIFARFMTDIGAETWFIGLSLSLYGIPFALTAPIAGRFADRLGPLRVIPISVAVIVPLTLIYGQMTTPGLVMSLAMAEAVANGAGMPAAQSLMASATADGERATGQGLAAAAGQVAAGVAALVSAPLYASSGPGATFAVVAAAVLVMAAIGMAVGLSAASRDRSAVAHTRGAASTPVDGR